MPSGRGAPAKPTACRCESSACTAGVCGPAGRRTVSPTRTTPGLTFPPCSGSSACWPRSTTAPSFARGGGGPDGSGDPGWPPADGPAAPLGGGAAGAPRGNQEYRAVRVCQLVVPFGFLLPTDHSVPEPVVTRPSKLSTL